MVTRSSDIAASTVTYTNATLDASVPSGDDYTFQMGDDAGSNKFILQNNSQTDIFAFDSLGSLVVRAAANDANPQFRLGATDAEEFHIQAVYDSGAQTLDYVLFQTDVASATADKGEFRFNVDGTLVATIDDGGIELKANGTIGVASGNVTFESGVTFASQTIADLGTVTTADIDGGTIDGVTIGGGSAGAGTFTSLNANGGGNLTGTWTDLGAVTTVDINGGTIDGTTLGANSPSTGVFTALNINPSAAGSVTATAGTQYTGSIAGNVQTTEGTQTTIVTFTLGVDQVFTGQAIVSAVLSDGSKGYHGIIAYGARKDGGAGVSEVMANAVLASANSDAAVFTDVAFSVSGDTVLLQVTGAEGSTIKWTAEINYSVADI